MNDTYKKGCTLIQVGKELIKPYPIQEYCEYNGIGELETFIMNEVLNNSDRYRDNNIFEIFKLLETLQDKFIKEVSDFKGSNYSGESIPDYYIKNKGNKKVPFHFTEPVHFAEYFHLTLSESSLLRYLSRYKSKNGIKDLEKCKFYACYVCNGNYDLYETYKLKIKLN